MPDEVTLDVTTIEENVTVETTAGDVVEIQVLAPSGAAATITVGTTTTLAPGSSATVANAGTSSAAVFNFGIPTGATGATGPNSVTSATTSNGTANLTLNNVSTVSFTAGNSSTTSGEITIFTNGPVFQWRSDTVEYGERGFTFLTTDITSEVNYTLPNATGTIALTTSNVATATALQNSRNIFGIAFNGTANVAGDATNTGHFASIPTGGQAGHFVTLNGTAPTVVAGRSAWWSDGSGNPSFRNGTGTAVTLVKSSDLGTNVATFLETPTSANLASAVTDETGSGSLVFATSPTLTTPTIAAINGGTAANDDITIQGTTNATRTTSYVNLQPNGGLVGIGISTPVSTLHPFGTSSNASLSANTGILTVEGSATNQISIGLMSTTPFGAYIQVKNKINNGSTVYPLSLNPLGGEVGIGTSAPNAAALLDVTSTTKGFLPPRMTLVQRTAIASPPAGLMIYNTTSNKLNVYNGTAWEVITSV